MISELWNRLDPGFFAPVWLGVGLLAVLAVFLLEIGSRRQRRQAILLFAASHLVQALTASVSPTKRLLKRVLLITAVALLFVALARPHLLYDWREENRTGLDILVAVDCSKSMLTQDAKPSRIERAKLALADFADQLPNNRLGLIAFAGDAFLQCPLTLDHDAFQTAVRELDTDTIPRPGTDIATAIDQAIDALKSQPNNRKLLILVTDGEDLEGHVIDEARVAAQNGLKIYTVGVGTPEGGQIPLVDDTGAVMYLRDSSGQIVQSKLDEETLRQIASITGGAYVPLGQRGEGLDEIYNRYIAPLPKQNLEEQREKVRFERFEWPLALGILLLIWEFLTGERAETSVEATTPLSGPARPGIRRRSRKTALAATPLVTLGLLFAIAPGAARASDTSTAERDYQSGNYQDALDQYRKAAEDQPDRSDLQFNHGDAAYKAGNFTEAEQAFRKALETPDLNLQEKSYYNLGNSQFKDGEAIQKVDTNKTIDLWQHALQSYESALKLRDSADTRHNHEIVKERLEQLKQQQQQQQQQNNPSQPQKDQSGKNSQPDKSQNNQQQQNQQNQQKPNNGQNQQPSQSSGNNQQQNQPDAGKKDQNGQQQMDATAQQRAYSQARPEDKEDPVIKSRQEAEALLDSLKEDEGHITARSFNALKNNNEPPPPPPSGKDW
ncbi:MAG: VWA domain-containing protein [Methylacidiphilales bacterium]|nr:VWA domain-containing protein [Candidatus Methylacidiphilales bacterium]